MWSLVSRNALFMLVVAGFLVAPVTPVAAFDEGEPVATGHIRVGIFQGYRMYEAAHVILYGSSSAPLHETPFSFIVHVSGHQDQWLQADVTDNSGGGYFVYATFYDDEEKEIDEFECEPSDGDHGLLTGDLGYHEIQPVCLVPEDAAWLVVSSHTGADLDVDLLQVAGP